MYPILDVTYDEYVPTQTYLDKYDFDLDFNFEAIDTEYYLGEELELSF